MEKININTNIDNNKNPKENKGNNNLEDIDKLLEMCEKDKNKILKYERETADQETKELRKKLKGLKNIAYHKGFGERANTEAINKILEIEGDLLNKKEAIVDESLIPRNQDFEENY
jgi:hypothetical protein